MPLKIALSSYTGYGAWFQLRLLEEGHKVDYYLTEPEYENILSGYYSFAVCTSEGIERISTV